MPYAHIRKRIPRELDRRVKLDDSDRREIVSLHKSGMAIREIARRFEKMCSRRLIQYTIYPERLELVREQFRERRKDGRYYNKDKQRVAVKNHRRYKQSIKDKLQST